MILDRLQLIATAVAPHHHKARWLPFWNSGTHTREALHFPAKGFKTEELGAIRSGSTITRGGSKARTPTQGLRNLRTIHNRHWRSSASSSGLS